MLSLEMPQNGEAIYEHRSRLQNVESEEIVHPSEEEKQITVRSNNQEED